MTDPTDAVPPAPPAAPAAEAPVVPAVAAQPVAPVVPPAAPAKKRRGFGVWSFVLGLLAVLSDLLIVVLIAVALGSAFTNFTNGVDDSLAGGLAGVLVVAGIAAVAYWGAIGLAGLSILFGIIALFRGGRGFAVVGMIFSIAVLAVNLLLLNGLLTLPDLSGNV